MLIKKITELRQENISSSSSETKAQNNDEEAEESPNGEVFPEATTTDNVATILPSPQKADLSFQQEEEEENEEYDEEEDEENTDPIENRLGGKLIGIATPVGQKQLFNSPALTKSGQKVYEKYNVHWR